VGAAIPVHLERGHPSLYAAILQLAKNPAAAERRAETTETLEGTSYVKYVYGHAPLGIPIENLELWVRRSNRAAWLFIVRPDDDPGLYVDDFAPPGGTRSLAEDTKDSLDPSRTTDAMVWTVTKGPLAGSVVLLRRDQTFAIASRAQAALLNESRARVVKNSDQLSE